MFANHLQTLPSRRNTLMIIDTNRKKNVLIDLVIACFPTILHEIGLLYERALIQTDFVSLSV